MKPVESGHNHHKALCYSHKLNLQRWHPTLHKEVVEKAKFTRFRADRSKEPLVFIFGDRNAKLTDDLDVLL